MHRSKKISSGLSLHATPLRDNAPVHHSKIDRRMAQMGHERRFCDVCGTSALPPILPVTADFLNWQIRANRVLTHRSITASLIDNLVGASEQHRLHVEGRDQGSVPPGRRTVARIRHTTMW